MRPIHRVLLPFAVLVTNASIAQPCDCSATFDWMVSTFEQNDAGFKLVLDRKGEAAYAEHTEGVRARLSDAKDLMACTELLNQWLQWFRRGHIGIGPTEKAQQSSPQGAAPAAALAKVPAVGRTVELTEAELVKRLERMGNARHPLEGVWSGGPYRVGIVRQPKDSTRFDAVILTSKNQNWKPGEVKVELERQADGRYTGTYYMGDHSPDPVEAVLQGSSGSLLQMGAAWTREVPAPQFTQAERMHQRAMDAEVPFLERLNERCTCVFLPSPSSKRCS